VANADTGDVLWVPGASRGGKPAAG